MSVGTPKAVFIGGDVGGAIKVRRVGSVTSGVSPKKVLLSRELNLLAAN